MFVRFSFAGIIEFIPGGIEVMPDYRTFSTVLWDKFQIESGVSISNQWMKTRTWPIYLSYYIYIWEALTTNLHIEWRIPKVCFCGTTPRLSILSFYVYDSRISWIQGSSLYKPFFPIGCCKSMANKISTIGGKSLGTKLATNFPKSIVSAALGNTF